MKHISIRAIIFSGLFALGTVYSTICRAQWAPVTVNDRTQLSSKVAPRTPKVVMGLPGLNNAAPSTKIRVDGWNDDLRYGVSGRKTNKSVGGSQHL